jgi:hypothetical protein
LNNLGVLRKTTLQTTPELVIGSSGMKPVKRELVTLPELRRGDTCVITMERDAYLLVKVVGIKPAENILLYTPAILRTVSATEFVAAGDDVYVCTFAPGKVCERVFLEGEDN